MNERIGFVGLGRMGANIARRLKDCGFHVSAVHDTRPDVTRDLARELGTFAADSLAAVTAHADVIFTVVTDDAAMKRIFAGRGDSLFTGAKGRIFVNCATVSPAVHVELAKQAKKAGASTLEACMASSITQARNGTLYLMIGGDDAVYQRIKHILVLLSDEGKLMRYVGAAGRAAQLKALVNMVMNINTAGLAEGLALADALGLDLGTVREVFSQTGAASRVLVTDGEDMQKRDHSCYFSAAHAAKDSGIALALARKAHVDAPLAAAACRQFERMVQAGLGDLDKSGVAELTFKGRGPRKSTRPKPAGAKPKKARK